MSDVAIRVEGLGKEYRLGARKERYQTFGDQIKKWTSLRRLLRRARNSESHPPFWALKNVSFEVKKGEVVGIIGRNGAGKSTLLKILSRITEPTEGGADIYGRVGSLLEVGTGFHPELTGRENVYLNGAILGMKRSEIMRKFDEIVAFAEVEKFIDTAVKHYSSGMYMRLAFAVAAHLDPEILIVDEVLAVGDANFQKKCLGKMGDVAKGGRTVLFVSHNMGAVRILCSHGLILQNGQITYRGEVAAAIDAYNSAADEMGHIYSVKEDLPTPHFSRIWVFQDDMNAPPFRMDREIIIGYELESKGKSGLLVGTRIRNAQGITVIHSSDEFLPRPANSEDTIRHCVIPPYTLAEGTYYVRCGYLIRGGESYHVLEDVISFRVEYAGTMADKTNGSQWVGVTGPGIVKWNLGKLI